MSRRKAPVPFWMPDLSGRPAIEAAAWLEACGFPTRMDESSFPGEAGAVLRQEPAPGTPIWPETSIHLTVARDRNDSWNDDDGDRGRGDDGGRPTTLRPRRRRR